MTAPAGPDALLFDFDGVIVDSEPVHMACFQEVLARRGLTLTRQAYYSTYLGYDDHDCFLHVLVDQGRAADEAEIARMTAEKTRLVQRAFAQNIQPLSGAVELMRAGRQAGSAIAICSGALREEIELAGRTVGALALVDVLVAARDVQRGKPDPEGYTLAMRLLREKLGRRIEPARTWVIEDSPAGIEAGQAAGCRVLAVATSYDRAALAAADRIVGRLTEAALEDLRV